MNTGTTVRESHTVDKDASKSLRAELRIGAGTLKVGGGSSNFMTGDFNYNVAAWKPEIKYSTMAGEASLTVQQPGSSQTHVGDSTNEWNVRLNNDVPTDLTIRMGAGETTLDLGSLVLRNLDIEIGAGELHVDLRGKPKHDYDVRIRGGAGEATIYLPHDAAIDAKAKGGIGEIKVKGLRKDGDRWVSESHGDSKVQIHLDIQGGVGEINLIAE